MSQDKFLYWQMLMIPTRHCAIKEIKASLAVAIINLAAEYSKPAKSKGRWHVLLYRLMLWTIKRKYFIDKVKKPLMDAIVNLAMKYPEPTMDNTCIPNTAKLLNIRDKFFEYEDNPGRKALFEAIWQMFIVEYEHDGYYRYRIDWLLEEINKCGWEPRKIHNEQCWKEPESVTSKNRWIP